MSPWPWLQLRRSDSPLILAFPHGGTLVPPDLAPNYLCSWRTVQDADWHIADLDAGLADATAIATNVSRSVIDVNRDPTGASLDPGQATSELCPTTTFDGEPLYRDGSEPSDDDIAARRAPWFAPYHASLREEVLRLRQLHDRVVVYDCHSIRSRIPRLFGGELPELNIGTNGGATCSREPTIAVANACAAAGRTYVIDGRFRGGWTTRHYGTPDAGVHAIQMELACRTYMPEPKGAIGPDNWPAPLDPAYAAPLRKALAAILAAALSFAKGPS